MRALADQAVDSQPPSLTEPECWFRFNYLGRTDLALPPQPPFTIADGETGPTSDPRQPMAFPFELTILVDQDRLALHWRCNGNSYDQTHLTALAETYNTNLQTLTTLKPQPTH